MSSGLARVRRDGEGMTADRLSQIDALIDEVRQAVESERNRRRQDIQPAGIFALEEPIASAMIFDYDVNRFFSDPPFYFEYVLRQKLWRWENYPDDDAPITMDLSAWLGYYPEYTFLGMSVEFSRKGVPGIQIDHPMTAEPDLRLLEPVDFRTSGWMPRILGWYDDLQAVSAGRMNVTFDMVWWRGCLDLAIQLRGYEGFIADTVEHPTFLHDLMKFLVEQRIGWWDAYYQHFRLSVTPSSVADDWINVPFISPQIFADFVLPRYLEIEAFHGGISDVHSCGNQVPVQRYLLEVTSLQNFEVSAWSDLTQSLRNIPPEKHLSVQLHPNDVLCATPEEMEARLRFVAESCNGRSYEIATSGLTPIWDDIGEYIGRVRTWTAAVQRVLGPLRQGASVGGRVSRERPE